jgi:hypothetical protein
LTDRSITDDVGCCSDGHDALYRDFIPDIFSVRRVPHVISVIRVPRVPRVPRVLRVLPVRE